MRDKMKILKRRKQASNFPLQELDQALTQSHDIFLSILKDKKKEHENQDVIIFNVLYNAFRKLSFSSTLEDFSTQYKQFSTQANHIIKNAVNQFSIHHQQLLKVISDFFLVLIKIRFYLLQIDINNADILLKRMVDLDERYNQLNKTSIEAKKSYDNIFILQHLLNPIANRLIELGYHAAKSIIDESSHHSNQLIMDENLSSIMHQLPTVDDINQAINALEEAAENQNQPQMKIGFTSLETFMQQFEFFKNDLANFIVTQAKEKNELLEKYSRRNEELNHFFSVITNEHDAPSQLSHVIEVCRGCSELNDILDRIRKLNTTSYHPLQKIITSLTDSLNKFISPYFPCFELAESINLNKPMLKNNVSQLKSLQMQGEAQIPKITHHLEVIILQIIEPTQFTLAEWLISIHKTEKNDEHFSSFLFRHWLKLLLGTSGGSASGAILALCIHPALPGEILFITLLGAAGLGLSSVISLAVSSHDKKSIAASSTNPQKLTQDIYQHRKNLSSAMGCPVTHFGQQQTQHRESLRLKKDLLFTQTRKGWRSSEK